MGLLSKMREMPNIAKAAIVAGAFNLAGPVMDQFDATKGAFGNVFSSAAQAGERAQTRFSSEVEATRYAKKNGLVVVHTANNGTVFVTEDTFKRIEATPGFKANKRGSDVIDIITEKPDTEAIIKDEFVVGGKGGRIDVTERGDGGRIDVGGGGGCSNPTGSCG